MKSSFLCVSLLLATLVTAVRSNVIKVLSVDYKDSPDGMYFSFDRTNVEGLEVDNSLFLDVTINSPYGGVNDVTREVIVWGNHNGGGGLIGDAVGRFVNDPAANQFAIGDVLRTAPTVIKVLAVDHHNQADGKYFSFDRADVVGLEVDGEMKLFLTFGPPDDEVTEEVIVWGMSLEGSSEGDAHGRLENGESGQFEIGDVLRTAPIDLTEKWNIGEVNPSGAGDSFTYDGISSDMSLSNMRSSIMPGGDCNGTPIATEGGLLSLTSSQVESLTIDLVNGVATVAVNFNMETVSTDESSALWTAEEGPDGSGTLRYCVRYGLWTVAGDNEVNFSEILVTEVITMNGDFAVSSVSVTEKKKAETKRTQEYTVSAALCSTGEGIIDGIEGAFLQGSLVCVKVSPSANAVKDGVGVTKITGFKWTNTLTEQVALPNEDGLTTYDDVAAADTFSTILYAQFYASSNSVTGTGTANLGFTTARRLGAVGSEMNGRVLQVIDAEQEFGIVVDIVKSDDSPTAFQTAGGATASFVVTIVGLVGAVLLA